MTGKRDFFTGSVRIISDPRLTGLDLRVYACVSMHDGMSLKKGSERVEIEDEKGMRLMTISFNEALKLE